MPPTTQEYILDNWNNAVIKDRLSNLEATVEARLSNLEATVEAILAHLEMRVQNVHAHRRLVGEHSDSPSSVVRG